MAVDERRIDDLPRPLSARLTVDGHLVPVPGFDGREEARAGQLAHGNVAGAGLGPWRRVALGDFGAAPMAVFFELEEMDAAKAGGENFVAAIAIPVDWVNAVHDAAVFVADELPFPLAGTVENQRRPAAVVGGDGISGGERRVDYHALAAAIDIRGAQAMGGGELVDILDGPRLARVAIVAEQRDLPDAAVGLLGEPAG